LRQLKRQPGVLDSTAHALRRRQRLPRPHRRLQQQWHRVHATYATLWYHVTNCDVVLAVCCMLSYRKIHSLAPNNMRISCLLALLAHTQALLSPSPLHTAVARPTRAAVGHSHVCSRRRAGALLAMKGGKGSSSSTTAPAVVSSKPVGGAVSPQAQARELPAFVQHALKILGVKLNNVNPGTVTGIRGECNGG
jgi:hypothetical protein